MENTRNDGQQPGTRGVQGGDGDGLDMEFLELKPASWSRSTLVPGFQRPMTDPRASMHDQAPFIRRAKTGDAQAFDHLARAHFARVYALLFRMIGNHEDAEDLAQECFIKAQGALEHFREQSSFSTWLFRIAVHLSRDHFRKKRQRMPALELVEAQAPASAIPGPVAETSSREFQMALRHAMDRLPHKWRVALVLRTQEGLEYGEIAQVLDCKEQTARVYAMKARKQLRAWLDAWKGEENKR